VASLPNEPPAAEVVQYDEKVDATGAEKDPETTDSRASQASTAASLTPDVGEAQQVIKDFVHGFVQGRPLMALSMGGLPAECHASLDRKLTTLTIKRNRSKRGVPLETIAEICVGEEAAGEIPLPVDEQCVALLLEDGTSIGFRFEDIEDRDTFALCLSMFVDGRRSELERKRKKKKEAAEAASSKPPA